MKLNSEVAAKYKLVDINHSKIQFASFGVIDVTKIDVTEADILYKAGFPHLVLKKTATVK